VGHTERFNPAVRAVVDLSIRARFLEVDRISPMSFRSLDVGVVMDLMIHDLDIVLTLAGSPLQRVDATGVPVLGEHEDIANARLVFANGCVANLTASRLALKTERRMRVFSEDAYVSLDFHKQYGLIIRKAANADLLERVRHELAAGADLTDLDYTGLVNVDELQMDAGGTDALTAEWTAFLDCVRTGSVPVVDGRAGLLAVDAADRVVRSLRQHRWEGLASPRP
jgi:predicted dehydrogenase